MTSEPFKQAHPYFLQEAAELLQQIDDGLQILRQDFSVNHVHTLMRVAHTLKGAAASVGLDAIKTTTHTLEDIFRALCVPETSLTSEVEGLIFEAYDCLQLLLSVQLASARVDEADILDRMAGVVTQLQTHLGDNFGQDGYLPTSTELGFDMTQSIFEVGVTQRLDDLKTALKNPEPEPLASLLRSQAEIFIGLAESLDLPGFGEIAQTTLTALSRRPDQVTQIAQIALEDYRSSQVLILAGNRTQGGQPSLTLKQLATGSAQPPGKSSSSRITKKQKPITTNPATKTLKGAQVATEPGWFGLIWRRLNQPIGKKSPPSNSRTLRKRSPTSTSSIRKAEKASASIRKAEKASAKPSPVPSLDTILGTVETSTSPESFSTTPTIHASTAPLPAEDSATPVSAPLPVRSLKTAEAKSSAPSQKRQPSLLNPQPGTATLRVSVEHLEQINHTVGELLTQQNRQALYNERLAAAVKALLTHLGQQQHQLHKLQNQASQHSGTSIALNLKSASLPLNHQFDSLELDHYSELQLLVQASLEKTVQQAESTEVVEFLVGQTNQILAKQQRLVSNLRETILEARMQPLGNVLHRFHQALERLTTQYNKPAALKIQGSDVLVDKVIADKLYDPLLHLVRNAFDHGIEPPELRRQRGKSAPAQIQIQASQEGRHLLIRVWDNGRGLNLDAIREKAIDSQLITEATAQTLTPAQTIDLLFEPGFSTVDQVDDLSGRGIGLDAVRAQVQALQGKVTVSHRTGQGTCFTLRIPANLVIAKLLLCQAQDKVYALMTDAVEQILIPRSDQLRTWKGKKVLSWQLAGQDRLISVIPLSNVLHYNAAIPNYYRQETDQTLAVPAANPIILLQCQDGLIGLEVDQLLGEQELFIRPLGAVMTIPNYLYGCTILPDGHLTLVVDSIALSLELMEQSAQSSIVVKEEPVLQQKQVANGPLPSSATTSKKTVLIVDDSITVRRTLTKTLRQAGYSVLQAKDGADALQYLQRVGVEAILCDIEMPGMNGFEFLKARQQDLALQIIPTIMLTSRTGTKHQLLAKELGATSYLTKPYLAPQLLETIAGVLESPSQSQLSSKRGDSRG